MPQRLAPGSDPDEPTARVAAAFWLLPCEDDARWLQPLIRELAQRLRTPVFEPHVTLHVDECPQAADIAGAIAATAASWPPLSLNAHATCESDAYYRSVFVEIAADEADGPRLDGLRRQLVQALIGDIDGATSSTLRGDAASSTAADLERALAAYVFRPHLSLLYGNLAQPLRATLARQNDFRRRRLVFDRIAAVRPAAGCPDLSQVACWEVFAHQRMTGLPCGLVRGSHRECER